MATVPARGPRADWKIYSQEAQRFTATKLQTEEHVKHRVSQSGADATVCVSIS